MRDCRSVLRDLGGYVYQVTLQGEVKGLLRKRAAVGKLKGNLEPVSCAFRFEQSRVGIGSQRLPLEVNCERRRNPRQPRLVHQFERLARVILIVLEDPASHYRAVIRK